MFALVAARRQKEFKRGKLSSFCPFRSFRTSEKNTIRKVTLCIIAGRRGADPYKIKSEYSQQKKQKICTPSRQRTNFPTPAYPVSATPTAFASRIGQFPHFQRACRQCVHESARLSRALCSHAWYSRDFGERQNCRLLHCLFAARTCHALLPATNSCTPRWFGRRTA